MRPKTRKIRISVSPNSAKLLLELYFDLGRHLWIIIVLLYCREKDLQISKTPPSQSKTWFLGISPLSTNTYFYLSHIFLTNPSPLIIYPTLEYARLNTFTLVKSHAFLEELIVSFPSRDYHLWNLPSPFFPTNQMVCARADDSRSHLLRKRNTIWNRCLGLSTRFQGRTPSHPEPYPFRNSKTIENPSCLYVYYNKSKNLLCLFVEYHVCYHFSYHGVYLSINYLLPREK